MPRSAIRPAPSSVVMRDLHGRRVEPVDATIAARVDVASEIFRDDPDAVVERPSFTVNDLKRGWSVPASSTRIVALPDASQSVPARSTWASEIRPGGTALAASNVTKRPVAPGQRAGEADPHTPVGSSANEREGVAISQSRWRDPPLFGVRLQRPDCGDGSWKSTPDRVSPRTG